MSEDEYQQLVERVRQSVANPMISTDTGVEAMQRVGQLAAQEEVEWAVAGGLAMHLYGSPRLTKDVDIIASDHLSLTPQHRLSFGGSSYTLEVGKYAVQVDWIVRTDGYQNPNKPWPSLHRRTITRSETHPKLFRGEEPIPVMAFDKMTGQWSLSDRLPLEQYCNLFH